MTMAIEQRFKIVLWSRKRRRNRKSIRRRRRRNGRNKLNVQCSWISRGLL